MRALTQSLASAGFESVGIENPYSVPCPPGAVVSEAEFRDRGDKREEYHQWVLENQSLKRRIEAVDIANLAVFLSTSRADLISGQNIQVDGGW